MRTRLAVVALAAAALVLPVPPAGAGAPAPLPGGGPLLLPGASVQGEAPEVRRSVVLVLSLRDDAGLDALLRAQQDPGSPQWRRWLTPQQFTDRFGPSTATVALARQWAARAGLTVDEVSSNRTLVTLTGTTSQLERAFAVRLRQARLGSTRWVTPDGQASLPAALRERTEAVLGLSTLPTFTRATSPYRPRPTRYVPRDFNTIYSAPTATTGTGRTLAVITQGDLRQVQKDLLTFERGYHLPQVPMTVVQTTAASSDRSGQLEYDLDTQYSVAFAPGASRLFAYNAATLGDIRPLNRFVTERRALTASGSYGGCEFLNERSGDVAADDQVFQQAVAQGQTFWFSSGDDGSACRAMLNDQPVLVQDVNYPASSPYVVAVGGTTLTGSSTQPTREVTWSGSGGGTSRAEPAPPWQQSNGTYVRETGRGVPDIALDSDPRSGFTVIMSGRTYVVGGTSAAAPAWNGIWARVLQRRPAGFAAPRLYALTGALVDVTQGDNGAYQAQEGYDLTTGLGTPSISAVVTRIR